MDDKLKPLVISYSYLKEKTPNGQIQRVFWEDLCDHNYSPTVICAKNTNEEAVKDQIKAKVIPTYDSKFIRNLFRVIKHLVAPDLAYLPDPEYYSWAKISAIKTATNEIKCGEYDYIFSVSFPVSSHLVALEAKKASGLPWIASFYDPLFDNPFRIFKYKRLFEKDRKREQLIAENADAIIHTNQAIYDEWVERYGDWMKEKMYVLPLVFKVDDKSSEVFGKGNGNKNKFIISHIGTLYLDRTSVPFLKALTLLLEKHPELRERIEVDYVGTITPTDTNYIKDNGLSDVVNYVGYLSEQECRQYYEKSDLFLSIDANNSRNVFFPSKIMKYFYYGKPILGISPAHSALSYELEKTRNYCFSHDDQQGIAELLYRLIHNPKIHGVNITAYWKKYTMETVSKEYEKIVNKIIEYNKIIKYVRINTNNRWGSTSRGHFFY